MNYQDVIKDYNGAGLSCLPVKSDKSPAMSKNWKEGFDMKDFEDCYGIGLICGEKSSGLEVLDFDNHGGDAKANLVAWQAIPEVSEVFSRHTFVVEKSMSGGFHVMFKCFKNEGNRKLAQKLLDGKPDCFIETRGEGGYFVCAPTPGYKVLKGSMTAIPFIEEIDRAILIDNALAMNQVYPEIRKTDFEGSGDRPGDYYNSIVSENEIASILSSFGWKDLGSGKWRRPGKKEGISATLGKVAKNVFYCFSSNGFPFESGKAYTAFQILGLCKYGGNFSEAAKSIEMPEKQKTGTKRKDAIPETELDKILNSTFIDTRVEVERPPVILAKIDRDGTRSIERRMFTLGNFSCITGKAKSKKTYLISLLTSTFLSGKDNEGIIRPFVVDGKNEIIYFDTEQSEFDAQNVIKRIEKMGGTGTRIKGYNLRAFSPRERCQLIEHAMSKAADKTGIVVIDGIADLATAVNDEDEATRVVTILMKLSKNHKCHIITVLHQNKADEYVRGHLGTYVMIKAETIIEAKNTDEGVLVTCNQARGEQFEPFIMRIDSDGNPKISTEGTKIIKEIKKPAFDKPKEEEKKEEVKPVVKVDKPLTIEFTNEAALPESDIKKEKLDPQFSTTFSYPEFNAEGKQEDFGGEGDLPF